MLQLDTYIQVRIYPPSAWYCPASQELQWRHGCLQHHQGLIIARSLVYTQVIYRLALGQVECTGECLLNYCKQNMTSLSLSVGTIVHSLRFFSQFSYVLFSINTVEFEFVDLLFFSALCLLYLCVCLFICALSGKELTSWLSCVVNNCELATFTLVSCVRWVLNCIDSWSLLPYAFLSFMDNSRDTDQMVSPEASWSGSKLFSKYDILGSSRSISKLLKKEVCWAVCKI